MSRKHIIVDVESDGPCPGLYSMVSFGAILLDEDLETTFYGKLKPISDQWIPEALAVSGHTREECMEFEDPKIVMTQFSEWLNDLTGGNRCYFWSDNNGFDFAFINYYFHAYTGKNPFGWSSNNIPDFYKGICKNVHVNHKRYRKTKHTHHPVDDAKGNAEALMTIIKKYGVQIPLSEK